jgi:hypothetical protein
MAAPGSLDRTAKLVIVAVFLAMLIDGMDSQMLALSLPSISKELRLSTILAGALGTTRFSAWASEAWWRAGSRIA